jgi:hypothetical protein
VQPQAVGGRLAAAAGAGEFLWVVTIKKTQKIFIYIFTFACVRIRIELVEPVISSLVSPSRSPWSKRSDLPL